MQRSSLSVRVTPTKKEFVGRSNITGYAINNIPDGYDIYTINQIDEIDGNDIWFVNTEKVKVTATYNESYGSYGYYTFGEVVEKTK